MVQQAAHEPTTQLRKTEPVFFVQESILPCLDIRQADVKVRAVAGEVRERLGHERGPQAVLLRHRPHHPLEESVAVGGRQSVGVSPVDFELAVCVLVIIGVWVPTQILHVMQERGHQIEVAVQRTQIVAGLGSVIQAVPRLVLCLCVLL